MTGVMVMRLLIVHMKLLGTHMNVVERATMCVRMVEHATALICSRMVARATTLMRTRMVARATMCTRVIEVSRTSTGRVG